MNLQIQPVWNFEADGLECLLAANACIGTVIIACRLYTDKNQQSVQSQPARVSIALVCKM